MNNSTRHNSKLFFKFLYDHKLEVFNPIQVESYFGKLDSTAYKFLHDLVKRAELTKLKPGLYGWTNSNIIGENQMPNWHKVAAALVYPKDYYIGFYSALQIHDLVTQPLLKEYVVTKKQVNPKRQLIQNVPFEIIFCNPKRFFGIKKCWINDHDKVYCSNLEKTIIDCLYKPQYAGGIEGIVKAIYKSRHKIKPNLLIEYAMTFDVQAVIKRLGFVLEKLDLFPIEQNILNKLITESYTKLAPAIKTKGTFHRKWRIEDNIIFDNIKQTIHT